MLFIKRVDDVVVSQVLRVLNPYDLEIVGFVFYCKINYFSSFLIMDYDFLTKDLHGLWKW